MILDAIDDGKFIFKNTYGDNKQVEMAVDAEESPDEFFFVHIKFTPTEETLKKIDGYRKNGYPKWWEN